MPALMPALMPARETSLAHNKQMGQQHRGNVGNLVWKTMIYT